MGVQRLIGPEPSTAAAASAAFGRERRISPLLLGIAVLLALLIALVGLAVFLFTRPPPAVLDGASYAAFAPSANPPIDVGPTGGALSPTEAAAPAPRESPASKERPQAPPTPAAPPASAERPLVGVPEVVDTGTLRINGRTVTLRGVRGEGGSHARRMASYIGGREASCAPASADLYRCVVAGWDLSEVVLFNGGGLASADAPAALRRQEDKAREAGRGVWAGRRPPQAQ